MMRYVLLSLAAPLAAGQGAMAEQAPECPQVEAACILSDAWSAALVLPPEKLTRVKPLFLEIAALSGQSGLLQAWQAKLGPGEPWPRPAYRDFGWEKAEPVLRAEGVEGLISKARHKQAPLDFARGDALLAAGKYLADTDGEGAARLNEALLDLAATASDFEGPDLAHAASELAMYRCDLATFDRARSRTHAPNSLRFAIWRARITGDVLALRSRIRDEADDTDTRHVRQVLGGYRAILELDYCS